MSPRGQYLKETKILPCWVEWFSKLKNALCQQLFLVLSPCIIFRRFSSHNCQSKVNFREPKEALLGLPYFPKNFPPSGLETSENKLLLEQVTNFMWRKRRQEPWPCAALLGRVGHLDIDKSHHEMVLVLAQGKVNEHRRKNMLLGLTVGKKPDGTVNGT